MKYADIKISDDDLAVENGLAELIYDRDVIVQDVVHALRESGLLLLLIGERSGPRRTLIRQRAVRLAEADGRIIPGSVTFTGEREQWLIAGKTYEFGKFEANL